LISPSGKTWIPLSNSRGPRTPARSGSIAFASIAATLPRQPRIGAYKHPTVGNLVAGARMGAERHHVRDGERRASCAGAGVELLHENIWFREMVRRVMTDPEVDLEVFRKVQGAPVSRSINDARRHASPTICRGWRWGRIRGIPRSTGQAIPRWMGRGVTGDRRGDEHGRYQRGGLHAARVSVLPPGDGVSVSQRRRVHREKYRRGPTVRG
jgi:hypothetical protein